jgi:hypothetical protein
MASGCYLCVRTFLLAQLGFSVLLLLFLSLFFFLDFSVHTSWIFNWPQTLFSLIASVAATGFPGLCHPIVSLRVFQQVPAVEKQRLTFVAFTFSILVLLLILLRFRLFLLTGKIEPEIKRASFSRNCRSLCGFSYNATGLLALDCCSLSLTSSPDWASLSLTSTTFSLHSGLEPLDC